MRKKLCIVSEHSISMLLWAVQSQLYKHGIPGKNNLFWKSNAQANELRHENSCVKLSS